jgi:hypothetical protein
VYGPGGGEFDLALNQGFLRNVMEINRVNGLEKFEEGAVFLPVDIMSFFKVQKIRRIFQVKSAQSLRSFVRGSTPVSRVPLLFSSASVSSSNRPARTRGVFLVFVFYPFLHADDGSVISVLLFSCILEIEVRKEMASCNIKYGEGCKQSKPQILKCVYCHSARFHGFKDCF